jgi:hypothetical protein
MVTIKGGGELLLMGIDIWAAISGDLLSPVISTRYTFGFRKDNPNVFNSLIQNWPHIPSDLVVDQWSSEGENSSHRDFLFLHDVCTTSDRLSSYKITPTISGA